MTSAPKCLASCTAAVPIDPRAAAPPTPKTSVRQPPRAARSGRPEASRAPRARSRVARIVEHVGRLKPDKATIRTRERERLRASVDRGAAGNVLERDALVPAMPVLTATEGTRHARLAAPQEIKDVLRSPSYLSASASADAAERRLPQSTGPTDDPVRREHLASRASARRWLQASGQRSGRGASQSTVACLTLERR